MKANHKNLWTRDTRAQVGIGTMIVFIATILVAATAAAVLIDTSGKLSERSAQTGNEATKQVASNLLVHSVTGTRLLTTGNLQYLNITVSLAPGGTPVNAEEIKIQYSDATATVKNLVWVTGDATSEDDEFNAKFERDTDTSANTITSGDLVDIQIDLAELGKTLAPRKEVNIQILPEVGASVDASFVSPDSYGTDKFIMLR